MKHWRSLLPLIMAGGIALTLSIVFTIRIFPEAKSQEALEEVQDYDPPEELDAPEEIESVEEVPRPQDPNLNQQARPTVVDPDDDEYTEGVTELPGDQLPQLPNVGGDRTNLLPPFDPGGYFPDIGSKRNPFQPSPEVRNMTLTKEKVEIPLEPLQHFELAELKVLGIMWDINQPRAMVADPTGKVHIVQQEQKLGRNNGVLALIREGELVVVENVDPGNGKIEYATRILAIGR